MTESESAEEILRVVREYSQTCERVAVLECRLKRIGKALAEQGPLLAEEPVMVDAEDLDFGEGEPRKSREELDAAYERLRELGALLNRFGLGGLRGGHAQ